MQLSEVNLEYLLTKANANLLICYYKNITTMSTMLKSLETLNLKWYRIHIVKK